MASYHVNMAHVDMSHVDMYHVDIHGILCQEIFVLFCFSFPIGNLCSFDPNDFENMKISVCWMAFKKICAIEF